MKIKKPLRTTVAHYIVATGQNKSKTRKRISMKDFFEDLENRGPFIPNSLFEKFTKSVRKEMQKEGVWLQDHKDNLEFVAEYIARLHEEFWWTWWRVRKGYIFEWHNKVIVFNKDYLAYRKLYLKIRIWGLRTKRFHLSKWPLTQYPRMLNWCLLSPIDLKQKYQNGEATFRYQIRGLGHSNVKYTKKEFPQGHLS